MIRAALIVLLAFSPPWWWRETNSRAAAARGRKAFERNESAAAAQAFQRANEIAPSPRSAFNLGTARIAAGDRSGGSAALEPALRDRALRADAYFNRGNSALGAGALDEAIADYRHALRADPRHAAAKRNLEIALARRQSSRRQEQGGARGQQGESQQRPSPSAGQRPPEGELDLESLLRSVQQQEEEELRRMKGRAGRGRGGGCGGRLAVGS